MIQNKYEIIRQIGNGQFGTIYEGLTKKKEKVAIKTEQEDCPISLLKQETTILHYLYEKGCRNVPPIYWYGPYNNQLALIMPFYDCTLDQYVRNNTVDVQEINQITIQMIKILIHIHQYGVIHRDIKPQNFMMKDNSVYLIDFGLATIYLDENNEHVKEKTKDSFIMGTPKFISLFIHYGMDPCRRDDLISVLYIYFYFLYEKLPWENINVKEDTEYSPYHILHPNNQMRKSAKEDFHNENKWKKKMFDYVYQIQYDEAPHYQKVISIIEEDMKI